MAYGDLDAPLAGVFPYNQTPLRTTLPQPATVCGSQPPAPTPADLVAVFPEFTNLPVARVQFQLNLAAQAVRYAFWGDRWIELVMLYAAHYLAVGAPASQLVNGVYNPSGGLASGVVTSKSVGGVSKSYNTTLGTTEGGGSFNLTIYGQQYLTILDAVPAIGLQL